MDIWQADKLVMFIAFVVPGFVGLKTYELLYPGTARDTQQQLIDAVAYSSINYGLMLWPIYLVEQSNIREHSPTLYGAFYAFVLLGAPVAWAFVLKWMRGRRALLKVIPHPIRKPWDFVFSQRQRYWVVVRLKDGSKIGGRYDSDSFSSSAPAQEQIFLQESWHVNEDGGLEAIKSSTAGVLILAADIVSIEFFEVLNDDTEATAK